MSFGLLFFRVSIHHFPNRPDSYALLTAGTKTDHASYGMDPLT